MKKRVHFILQGKGGVGKSVIAAFFAQYLLQNNQSILCIDTDPVNRTLAGYKSLDVKTINILDEDEINPRNFDVLVQNIIDCTTQDIIIDNGASSFVPLSSYIVNNDIPSFLAETAGCTTIIHVVITGGQAMMDTLLGLTALLEQFPSHAVKFVVWLNPYWGVIENQGKSFFHMRVFEVNQERILGVIELPNLRAETFGLDLSALLQSKKTFEQGVQDVTLPIMVRHRLGKIKKQIFTEISNKLPILNNIEDDDLSASFVA